MRSLTTRRIASGNFIREGLWKIADALATPRVPSDYLDLIDPMRAGADLRGVIVDIRPETADAATVVIRPGRGWRSHTPGQYIRIGIEIEGIRCWRAYSLTSPVRTADGTISVTVKAMPDGLVSNHIVRNARPGTMIMLDRATGEFTLPPVLPSRVLFVTAGSGITPVMGILRNHGHELADVVHIHCAPTESAVIFGDELRARHNGAYAAQSPTGDRPGYRLVERHDDEHGMLDLAADLDELVPDWRDRATWVCGPTGLLDAAEDHWAANDIADLLSVERFRPTIIEPGEGGTITFLDADRLVEADGATPILDAGEAAGVLMPSGCRMGICWGCVVTMREGAVRDLRNGAITSTDSDEPITIQTCINAVAGHCDLEL